MIRVVVADDQALVRGGLRVLVDSAPDFEAVGEVSDGTEAVALARKQRPDVILMDIRMPHLVGLEGTRLICGSAETEGIKVLILTNFDLDEYVYAALRAPAGSCSRTPRPTICWPDPHWWRRATPCSRRARRGSSSANSSAVPTATTGRRSPSTS